MPTSPSLDLSAKKGVSSVLLDIGERYVALVDAARIAREIT